MNSYKKFFYGVVGCIGVLVLFIFLLWYFVTSKLLSGDPAIGDLARMGYLPEILMLDKKGAPPGGKHLEYWEYEGQKIDIVTIGDSFSHGGGQNFYQDYLVGHHGMTVLNLTMLFGYPRLKDRLDPIVNLLNDGLFDKVKPRYVLLENVERYGDYLATDVDWQTAERADKYMTFLAEQKEITLMQHLPQKSFFNTAGLKYLLNLFTYRFYGHDYDSKIYTSNLTTDLFSSEVKSKFVFYFEDIKWADKDVSKIAEQVNSNLNLLAELLQERGVKLIYMPAVDKFDLYYNYIADNAYPQPKFFEKLRTLPKKYVLIDTKKILSEELARGEKDIYWSDDTHWSWKASRAIAENFSFDEHEPDEQLLNLN